jgi:putative ABC transport system ATP-binding protein
MECELLLTDSEVDLSRSRPKRGVAVRTDNLRHVYAQGATRIEAVNHINLEVPPGQFLSVMGPSGSGKSTLLHLLGGLRTPTAGKVWIGETEIQALSQDEIARFRRRNVGLVFQFFNLLPSLTVRQNVALPLLMDGVSQRHARDRVDFLLEELQISDRVNHSLSDLSGGQAQRVAIARALIATPRVILADEPTGNLDGRTGAAVLSLIREITDEHGVTTILMTHDPESRAYADRVVLMRDGQLVSENGTPDSVGDGESERDPE